MKRIQLALVAALALIILLTLGKSVVSMPGLWEASVHQTRAFRWIPFGDFFRYSSPIIPLYYLVSNVLLFVPFGWALRGLGHRHPVLFGFGVSVAIEVLQFVLASGFSDLNDVLQNTVGTLLGVWLFPRTGRWFATLIVCALAGVLLLYVGSLLLA